jgi:chromosomal replication initiation ATPase DnaA
MTVLLQARCGAFTGDIRCSGRVLATDEVGDLLHGECDRCAAPFAIPKLKADPALRRQRRLEAAGLPARFVGQRFCEDPGNREALQRVRGWLSGIVKDSDGRLIGALPAPVFWGDAGRGKTHLLVATCWKLINERDLAVMFWTVRGLMRALSQFDRETERRSVWERAAVVDVLALDDLGAMQSTDWRQDQLADLIEERYATERPVIVATNFPPSTWPDMLDARTASRLRGMCVAVELAGPDRRVEPMEGE